MIIFKKPVAYGLVRKEGKGKTSVANQVEVPKRVIFDSSGNRWFDDWSPIWFFKSD